MLSDLFLYTTLLKYKVVNSIVASRALEALQRHVWYLNGDMVPLALFSSKVSLGDRSDFANSLMVHRPDTRPGYHPV